MNPTARIERLRESILAQGALRRDEGELLWARSWLASAGEPWHIVRRGRATGDVLRGLSVAVASDDLLVGRFASGTLSQEEHTELATWRREYAPVLPPVYGQRAHMAIDYETLLRLGLGGLRSQIAGYRARLDLTHPEELERDAFYRACLLALDGLSDLSARYADEAERQAASAEPARAAELREIAAICRRVPEQPAATFHEALQAVHLVTFALCAGQMMLLFQLGHPDRYLLPYFRRDMAAGRLSAERAQELIDCLGLMLSAYTPRGLAVGYMVGGRNGSGADVCNELTALMLQSIAHIRLSYPGIGLCWHSETPTEITDLACRLLADGLTHPAVFNDEVITQGMRAAGLPPAEACLYQHSTCVEMTPVAASNVYVASPYINLVQVLHDVLGVPALIPEDALQAALVGGGAMPPAAHEALAPESFDVLLAAYEAHLSEVIRRAVVDENTCMATRAHHGGWPLLSCFVNDCLARGLDIDQGGARYNWIEPSFVGLSNLIDALAAMRLLVYEQGRVTMAELVAALHDDFQGREDLRLMLLRQAPKYGNDDDRVDALASRLTEMIVREVERYRTYLGGAFHPGFFCWVMHERLGAVTAASADGRRAGTALGDGSGPAQGRELRGPTAAILSSTKWNHTPMLGGIAVNLKFGTAARSAGFVPGLRALIETYLQRGGFEVQVNVVDRDTLRAAQANPEAYRDLVVRIGGYSDYFVGLSPRMQEEIILRTEHEAV
ncbi:MAG: pyruvate formate lyase family protein [Anaerolineae bacterium]